jgi:galactoside O-acetyltransferase
MAANSFYTVEELKKLGLKSCGNNVLISKFANIYSPNTISIGSNVRIDDFCILSGNITIKNNIHIAAYCALYGGGNIIMDDHSGLSARCTLLSATDDFSGEYLVGACVDIKYRNVIKGTISIGKYAQIGAGSLVMPNTDIGEGVAVGAMSFVNNNLPQWSICYGIPAKKKRSRERTLLQFIKK